MIINGPNGPREGRPSLSAPLDPAAGAPPAIAFPQQRETTYASTRRGLAELKAETYPKSFFQDLTPEMRIVDIGCGQGEMVTDLQKQGYRNAIGVDPLRTPSMRPYLLLARLQDLTPEQLGGHADRIFSSYAMYTYEPDERFWVAGLKKMSELLGPGQGGKIRLGGVATDQGDFERIAAQVPDLRITHLQVTPEAGSVIHRVNRTFTKPLAVELTKIIR